MLDVDSFFGIDTLGCNEYFLFTYGNSFIVCT